MLVSIIIPHYNSFESLTELLKSIPDSKELETLVIDDQSEHQYKLELLAKQFPHVLFLGNRTNIKNAGKSRNIGLDNAKGKWVIFADSDDYFLPNSFESLIKEITNTKSDPDVIYYKPTSLDLSTNSVSNRHLQYESLIEKYLNNEDESIRYRFYVPWSKIIKRSLVVKHNIRFDEVIASNDVMFSTKVGHYAKNIAVKNQQIYCVTKGLATLTTSQNKNVLLSRFNVQLAYNNFLFKHSKKEFQFSFLYLVKRYYRILTTKQLVCLISSVLKQKLVLRNKLLKRKL